MSPRQRVYRTEAVVLRRMDLGEADRLLTLFTPGEGKLRAVAKGVRRPGSRKAGHLEPFTRVNLLLARGRELDIITQAEAIDQYPSLRAELERLGQAAYLAELLDRFTVEEAGTSALYPLLIQVLDRLEDGGPAQPLLRFYELRLLEAVGYRPELFVCLGCGAQIEPRDQYFSPPDGGVLCPSCGASKSESRRISLAALKVLRHYQRSSLEAALAPKIRPQVHMEIESLMQAYVTYLLERQLNVPHFMHIVRDLGAKTYDGDPAA